MRYIKLSAYIPWNKQVHTQYFKFWDKDTSWLDKIRAYLNVQFDGAQLLKVNNPA